MPARRGKPQQPVMHLLFFHLMRKGAKGHGEDSSAAVTATELMRNWSRCRNGRDCTLFAQTVEVLATKSTIKEVERGSPCHSFLLSVRVMHVPVLHPGLLLNLFSL